MSETFEKTIYPFLNTRLLPPPARLDLIPRARLYEKLAKGLSYPLVLVVAPPGFGKTTLVSGWLRTLEGSVAWVTLDQADNDPARFWGYFTAAIERAYPVVLNPVAVPYQFPLDGAPMAPEAHLASLINSLSAISGDGTIVLDDFHLITAPLIINALTFFIEHLPGNLHLVLISRSEPHLPLPRLRARRQVLELHSNDLRFTSGEAAEFLNRVMGLSLTQANVELLEQRTEGWIAGLQLAALTILERENWQAALDDITGDNRYIQDYLVEEVFLHQAAGVQDFLVHTSILERLCGPLCDAVTGQPGSQAILETLEHANLFISPLDTSRHWYRYHNLLGDMLRSRLGVNEPQFLPNLHTRAARWFEANDDPSQAVTHYLAAGDVEQVAELIKTRVDSLLNQNGMATLLAWFRAMPEEAVRSRPDLSILNAWTLLYNARFTDVETYLKSAEKGLAISTDDPASIETWSGHIDAIRGTVAMNLGDEELGFELSQRALKRLPEHENFWRSILALNLGDGYSRRNEVDKALSAFQEAISAARQSGNSSSLLVIYGSQASLLAELGQLSQAEAIYRKALQTAGEGPDASAIKFPTLGKINAFYSDLLYEWNRIDEAVEQARQGIERCTQWGHLEHLVDSSINYALAKQASSEGEEGLAALKRVELIVANTIELMEQSGQLASNRKIRWTAERVLKMRLYLAVLAGDFQPLTSWMTERGIQANQAIPGMPLLKDQDWCLLLARWLMHVDRAEEAIEILDTRLGQLEKSRHTDWILSVLVLLAAAYHRGHNQAQAMLTLERALSIGQPQGYIRTFIDGGDWVRQLLETRYAQNERGQTGPLKLYIKRLLASFPLPKSATGGTSRARQQSQGDDQELFKPLTLGESLTLGEPLTLGETLSLREVRILTLVSAGLSNQEIAAALVVSTNTVKTHLKRIYAKLMVSSRVEAVEKARRSGLL